MLRGLFAVALIFGADLFVAQLAVWGLSLFHVSSGIWGPFILSSVLVSVIGAGVFVGQDLAK